MAERTPRLRRARSARSRLERSLEAIAGSVAPGICALVIACTPSDEQGAVSIGASAPPYRAVTVGGDSVSVEALRGKVVLLNIWATWCHPCREEIPVLQALHERHGRDGLEIVGVTIDAGGEKRRIDEFAERFGMTYALWHDPGDRISNLYRAVGVPATYLIDREGILRWRKVGPIAENDPSLARALSIALVPAETGDR